MLLPWAWGFPGVCPGHPCKSSARHALPEPPLQLRTRGLESDGLCCSSLSGEWRAWHQSSGADHCTARPLSEPHSARGIRSSARARKRRGSRLCGAGLRVSGGWNCEPVPAPLARPPRAAPQLPPYCHQMAADALRSRRREGARGRAAAPTQVAHLRRAPGRGAASSRRPPGLRHPPQVAQAVGESARTPRPVLQPPPHAAPGARVLIGLVEAGKAGRATNPCSLAAGGRRLQEEGGGPFGQPPPGLALEPPHSHTSGFAAALTPWEGAVTPLHPRGK